MAPTARNRRLLLVALLVPLLALAMTASFLVYRSLSRPPGADGPAPEPVIVVVGASFPGAPPKEVEQQVTTPLEITFAGLPHLQTVWSQSSLGTAILRLRFDGRTDLITARQEVINRLAVMNQPLPPGVTPQLSSVVPEHEVFRYTLAGPADAGGRSVYTLNDLRAVQDSVVEREFRRVPRIIDAEGRGGTVKRYEVHPDPDRLRQFGISLKQLQGALANANGNVGGDYVLQGPAALNVRGVGLFGGGENPMARVLGTKDLDPAAAAAWLREEDRKRIREIRSIVITSVNNRNVLLEDVVQGGRLGENERPGERGVVVGARRQGDVVALSLRRGEGADWLDQERVEGVVFLRQGEDAETALRDVRARVEELNDRGALLPGLRIEPLIERGGRPEDGFWMRAEFPRNIAPDRLAENLRNVRLILGQQAEVAAVLTETDEPNAEAPLPGSAAVFVRLKPGGAGARVTGQLQRDVTDELCRKLPGVRLTYTTGPPDNFAQAFEAAPGQVMLRLFGRDLDGLQEVVAQVDESLRRIQGVEDVRPVDGFGATRFDCRADPQKYKKWGVSADDVNAILQAALDGKAFSTTIEGEKQLDITVRWPQGRRGDETSILDLPLDVVNNQLMPAAGPGPNPGDPVVGGPRLRLRDLVSPLGRDGAPDPQGQFVRAGLAAIYRENGLRCVAVHFRLRDTSLDKVRDTIAPLIPLSCRAEWVGR
ncbi:MAG TPA: efflux RND transporter permease subunit [Gemmataceae bacterium]|nr:efflux RND transporter permease subunit [Gemmataceae bacterium]